MGERPILFSAPMVRALLAGTKTQTRRVIKPQPPADFISANFDASGALTLCPAALAFSPLHKTLCRLHKPGDRLWCREAWRADRQVDGIAPRDLSRGEPILFEADGASRQTGCAMISPGRLRASMHMPRWASRLTLIVTDVRVQRLQDISENDAGAEGIPPFRDTGSYISPKHPDGKWRAGDNAYAMYRDLWNAINGAGSWAANPWIVAYSFTVHQRNIDSLEERKALAEGETP